MSIRKRRAAGRGTPPAGPPCHFGGVGRNVWRGSAHPCDTRAESGEHDMASVKERTKERQYPMPPFDLPEGDPFGPHNLPYGVFSLPGSAERTVGVRLGDHVLDAGAAARALGSPHAGLLASPTLDPLLAAGRATWSKVRRALTEWVTDPSHRSTVEPLFHPLSGVTLHLPFQVADYVDFYSSEHHARNAGAIFRPDAGDTLLPNWKHLPIGYHGRAGTVVVSGTDVVRPSGQRKAPTDPAPVFGPSVRLDIEAEVGFVVGVPSRQGSPVALADFREHVFGLCLLNDWSARDLQAWEYVPLGPFLAKSFATSVSAWITPLEALETARVTPRSGPTPSSPIWTTRPPNPPVTTCVSPWRSMGTWSPIRPSPPCTGQPPSSSPTSRSTAPPCAPATCTARAR